MISPFSRKILTYYSEAKQIKAGLIPVPRMALLSCSSTCNANCFYCIYKKEVQQPDSKKFLPKERFYSLIDELAEFGLKGIDLSGGGEPLCYPEIDSIMHYIAQKGLKFGVISNGINFSGDVMKAVIKLGSYVRISLDSVDEQVYLKMKGVDKAKVVMENLTKACEYKNNALSSIDLSVKIGLTKTNVDVIPLTKTLSFLKTLDLTSVQIRSLRDLPPEEIIDEKILPNIANMIYQFDFAYSKENKKENMLVHLTKTKIDKPCWLTPIHTAIMADGNVYACCYYTARDICIGNILETPFNKLWGTDKHKEVLARLKPEECNTFDCKFHQHLNIMDDFLANGREEFI